MRPGLSVHHPLHTGAFRCTSIPGNDRRTNGVCYIGTCLMPPVFGWIVNTISPALFPVYLLFILVLMFVMHEKILKQTQKNSRSCHFSWQPRLFFYHDSFPKICSTISSCFFSCSCILLYQLNRYRVFSTSRHACIASFRESILSSSSDTICAHSCSSRLI